MARLALALIALAAIIAAAYLVGRAVERHHTAADYRTLTADLDALHAALTAIPAGAWEHRHQVAAEHLARRQATRDRLDAYFLSLRGVR